MKRIAIIALSFIAILMSVLSVACNETKLTLRAPADCEVQLGTYYSIPVVKAEEEDRYAQVAVTHQDGTLVSVISNQFHVAKTGYYTIRYYIQEGDKVLAEATQKCTVVDNAEPLIVLKDLKVTAALNSRVTLPGIEVKDSLGETITPTVEVSTDKTFSDESKKVDVDEKTNSFLVSLQTNYYIRVTAKNSRGGTSEKIIEVFVRKEGEIESADVAEYISLWTSARVKDVSFNSDEKYVKAGTGSIHVTAESVNYTMGNPEIILTDPSVSDLSEMKKFSFWVYNNGAETVNVMTLSAGSDASSLGIAYPGMWTKIELTKDEFASLQGWQGDKYQLDQFAKFNISLKGSDGKDIDVYIDEIFVSFADDTVSVRYESSGQTAIAGKSYTVAAPTVNGIAEGQYTIAYNVYRGEEPIALDKQNSFMADSGTYQVIATVSVPDGREWQARYQLNVLAENVQPLFLTSVAPSAMGPGQNSKLENTGIVLHNGGWGGENQYYEFTAYTNDVSGYAWVLLTLTNRSSYTCKITVNGVLAGTLVVGTEDQVIMIPVSMLGSDLKNISNIRIGFIGFTGVAENPSPDAFVGEVLISSANLKKADDIDLPVYSSYEETASVGVPYELPTDTLSKFTLSYSVSKEFGEKLDAVEGNTVTFTAMGSYVVTVYTETDEGVLNFAYMVVALERKSGEVESADNEDYLSFWTKGVQTKDLTFNSDAKFIKAGTGSFHITADAVNEAIGWAEINLLSPAITNLTEMTSFSFWIYNNGTEPVKMATLSGEPALFDTAYPGRWTKIELSKEEFSALKDWQGQSFDLANFNSFRLMFSAGNGQPVDVYLDEIMVTFDPVPSVRYEQKEQIFKVGGTYALAAPKIDGVQNPVVSYIVFSGKEEVKLENNSFTPAVGEYTVIAMVSDAAGNEWQARYILTVQDGNEDTDKIDFFIGTDADVVENTDPVGLHGDNSTKSIAVTFGWNAAYPRLQVQWPDNATKISFDVKIIAANGGKAFGFQNMTTGQPIGETIPLDTWTKVTIESGWIPNGQGFGVVKDSNDYAGMEYKLYFDNIVFE